MTKLQTYYWTLFIAWFALFPALSIAQQQVGGKTVRTGIWMGREVKYIDGEIALKLKPTAQRNNVNTLLSQLSANVKFDFDSLRWGLIELPANADAISVIGQLSNSPLIERAEPNFVMKADVEPNDPYYRGTSPATYPYQWGLNNTGQSPPSGTVDADIDAAEAWNVTTGNSNVIVAILDTGIPMLSGALSHPDLRNTSRIILGPDYIGDGEGVRDRYGHGTHVAGIVGAETNNNTGIAGICWNCKLMIIQVFDANGYGPSYSFYQGVVYAVDYKRNHSGTQMVINYSGGCFGNCDSQVHYMYDAVVYAANYFVSIVASAGNRYGGWV